MRVEKYRDIDSAELKTQLNDSEEQLFRLRFQLGMGQTEGLTKYRALRRIRARMLGLLREREIKGEVLPVAARVPKTAAKSRGKVAQAKIPQAKVSQGKRLEGKGK